jgi:SAM-dependent methyltransferase
MAKKGGSIHGEVDFIMSFSPRHVLDAGCGTGRVAIELAARGVATVGLDLDDRMIAAARRKTAGSANPRWRSGDVSDFAIGEQFDVVATPGNVMIFLAPGTESAAVACLAAHVAPNGRLIAGFQLTAGYTLAAYDEHCEAAGLRLEHRWASWDGAPFVAGGDYAVSVHRVPPT